VVRAAWQAIKKRKTIERLQERLGDCQTKYHLALTTDMRDEVLRLLEDQGKNTKSIHDLVMQRFDFARNQIDTLDKNITQLSIATQNQLSTLGERQRRATVSLRRGQHDLNRNIDSQFTKLSISSTHQDFLDSLYFPEMFTRQESIKMTSPGTYQWVFGEKLPPFDEDDYEDDYQEETELRGRISPWLREANGAPVFWISGKPGSGKSSLMAFIMGDERTLKSLEPWAGGSVPHIFSFFFWKPGSSLQKTMTGLRRSLIWQICKARPSTIDMLLSQDSSLLYSPWTETRLADTLLLALSEHHNEPMFFLIDGLDECETSHDDLLDELQALNTNPNNKVCISSRPDPFCQRLGALPSVRLQDLNHRDIFQYAHTKLQKGDDQTKRLARQVAWKAEGVFLWAVLVCDSICSGFMAEDDEQTLLQRLNSYPKGLDDLFDRMFANLEEFHYKSLAYYFYAARKPHFSVALAVASQPTQRIESLENFSAMCEREITRITQQSKGLLEITPLALNYGQYVCAWSLKDIRTGSPRRLPIDGTVFTLVIQHLGARIRFVHRSAYDYILGETSASRHTWLNSLQKDEIARKVLNGALWIFQYGPILHWAAGRLHTTTSLGMIIDSAISIDDLLKVDQMWVYNGIEKVVDSLHSRTSAVKDYKRVSQQATKSEVDRDFPRHIQPLLREFWYDILEISPGFVTSHSCQLCDRDDAYLNVAALFYSWSRARLRKALYNHDMDSAMFSVATEFRRRGLHYAKVTSSEMRLQRHSMFYKGIVLAEKTERLISWDALSADHEASYVLTLEATAAKIADTEREPDAPETYAIPQDQASDRHKPLDIGILEAYCVLVQTWRLFYATQCYVQGTPSPLQISVPMLYKYPPTSRYLNDVEIKTLLLSCREEKVLRLDCFAKRGTGRLGKAEHRPIPTSPAASYCLSSATSNALSRFSDIGDHNSDETRFAGSVVEFSDCKQAVMDDICDDAENQLTAWEQLYLRACVKSYFLHFWRRVPGQVAQVS
jgi:hypothetical protein